MTCDEYNTVSLKNYFKTRFLRELSKMYTTAIGYNVLKVITESNRIKQCIIKINVYNFNIEKWESFQKTLKVDKTPDYSDINYDLAVLFKRFKEEVAIILFKNKNKNITDPFEIRWMLYGYELGYQHEPAADNPYWLIKALNELIDVRKLTVKYLNLRK